MNRKEFIKNLAIDVFYKIEKLAEENTYVNETGVQIEIGSKLFEIDYNACLGVKRSKYDNDLGTKTISFNSIEVTNIWGDEDTQLTNLKNEINKQLDKIILE